MNAIVRVSIRNNFCNDTRMVINKTLPQGRKILQVKIKVKGNTSEEIIHDKKIQT